MKTPPTSSCLAGRHLRRAAIFLAMMAAAPFSHPCALAQSADPFSQAALNTVNSDLVQEISAGSSNSGTQATPIYFPSSNANMLPFLVGSTGAGGLQNLLKVSIPSPFYSGATYSGTGSARASAALTTGTSLNGVFLTPALWNQPLFLPVSGPDDTPLLTSGAFTPPNWILVAGDGSNPTTWSSGLITSSSNANPVVGRYAYAIYHEGGVLDANVAGYPSTSSTTQIAYKPALAYADLTQIGIPSSQVDMLVAWRNYASTQAPGSSFTAPDFTAVSASNYYQYVLSNTTGFLTPSTAVYNGQTDQMFTSRQQLINFAESGLGLSGTGLDILNYLATFTRGLNQPSVTPDPTRPLIQQSGTNGGNNAQGLDNQINPAFPTVLVTGTFTRNDGTLASIGQPLVNKRFALNRLAWLTYLGPSSNRIIPLSNPGITSPNYDMWQLVNTYGFSPAYLKQGTPANIRKYFGLTWQVDSVPDVKSGLANSFHDNEYKWFYQGHNNNSGTINSQTGAISQLPDIAAASGKSAREPDFFELLKAAVAAGSKAKGAFNSTSVETAEENNFHPYTYQNNRDTSLDYAIIQLGANIIDQFKVDGYSTRIVFSDGSDPAREFRGVENLPYIYRLQSATLKLRMENPVLTRGLSEEDSLPASPLTDTGVAMIMHIPTIWNPHDENAPLGDPAPAGPGVFPSLVANTSNFQLIADSIDPDDLAAATASPSNYTGFFGSGQENQNLETTAASNGTYLAISKYTYTTGPNGTGSSITPFMNLAQPPAPNMLTPANSALTFVVPNSTLFREPTVLAMASIPIGSNLQMATPITEFTEIENSVGKLAYSSTNGFLSDSPNPLDLPSAPPATQGYVGICAAMYPVEWPGNPESSGTVGIHRSENVDLDYYGGDAGPYVTYRLQYKDPNTGTVAYSAYSGNPTVDLSDGWVTYDEKYTQFETFFIGTAFGTTAGNLSDQADGAIGGDWQSYADPRTSRFAAVNGADLESPVQTPGGSGEGLEWADPNNAISVTDRPDINSGYGISDDRSKYVGVTEFYPLKANGWNIDAGYFRIGMLSQNTSAAIDNGIRFSGDSVRSPGDTGSMDYADPDGVLRGAMGNYVTGNPAITTVGLPLATAYPAAQNPIGNNPPVITGAYQGQSRPYILHRPFRSVGELGYVFSGTPWKNIDFFTPQSGDASLLDVFTINETPSETADPNELVAGVINLNTRQAPVLQAILAGASVDEAQTSGTANTGFTPLTGAQAKAILTTNIGTNFLKRTSSTLIGEGPLQNVSELVGRWNSALFSGINSA
jgi:hypothetical protein